MRTRWRVDEHDLSRSRLADFGSDMRALFETDLRAATPIEPGSWQARGVVERLEQQVARLFRYWL